MRVLAVILFAAVIVTSNSTLLEMSQTLWSKLLEGGLTKIGALDPLRVPVVKVDQSEGNTSYRMILRSVEIIGLNASSLESVHIARGRLKTNLSEHEAGYVSYTDQRELDTIRYRFHTVVKEPKGEESRNIDDQPIEDSEDSKMNQDQYGRTRNYDSPRSGATYQASSRYQDNRQQEMPQGPRPSSKYQENQRYSQAPQGIRSNYQSSRMPEEQSRYTSESQNPQRTPGDFRVEYQAPHRQESSSRFSSDQDSVKSPGRVRVVYAERQRYPQDKSQTNNQRTQNRSPDCDGSCEYRRNQGSSGMRDNQREHSHNHRQDQDTGVAASMNFESRRAYVDARVNPRRDQDGRGEIRFNNGPSDESRYAASFNRKNEEPNNNQRKYQRYEEGSSQTRMENQPGYVDIVYGDDKDQKMKRFGNLKVEAGRDTTVYSLDDVLRDLRDHKRFIIHNFTEGEALAKKNDAVRMASETKRIKDLVRYAREFQEMQGYYEQGMELIYHYGGRDNDTKMKVTDGVRTKRAHQVEKVDEDDIMHVVMRIRVPMLRVNAGYVLMGKVGKQVLRGNGLLTGNFTELIGDFTLELKKVDEDTMIVRAARARLSAKDQKITLQGMDEEGPVQEILTHGLMAAEAVAAMLADDLATKALSEKTADSIIYRMYKNLPADN